MCALIAGLRAVPIYAPGLGEPSHGEFANPSYAVSVTREEAVAAREKFNTAKEAKRLVPHPPNAATDTKQAVEEAAGLSTGLDHRAHPSLLQVDDLTAERRDSAARRVSADSRRGIRSCITEMDAWD